jgi:hypothetical protein
MAADGYTASGERPASSERLPGGERSTGDAQLSAVGAGEHDGAGVRSPAPNPRPHGEAVVTPHAVFLALDFAPEAALANLDALRGDFRQLYGPGGFRDSVNVATGRVADRYLALDQGMVMAACANALCSDRLQSYLAVTLRPALEPLMQLEEFSAGRVGQGEPHA